MLLVNGSKGIGTGFSTDIMCYNPKQIINYLKTKLKGKSVDDIGITPYYEGFQGTIELIDDKRYLIRGVYDKVSPDKIRVSELPIGFWTDDFKQHLESLMDNTTKTGKKKTAIVKSYLDMSTDTTVDIEITFPKGTLADMEEKKVEYQCNQLEKHLRLYTTNTTTNMHAFTHEERLRKYEKVEEIIEDYYNVRLKMYETRKAYIISALEREVMVLSNKARYIQDTLDDKIDLRRKKKSVINEMLTKMKFDIIDDDNDYKYLVKMPMDSVIEENVDKLLAERDVKVAELDVIRKTSESQMWFKELSVLEKQYEKYKEQRVRIQSGSDETSTKKVKKIKIVKKKK